MQFEIEWSKKGLMEKVLKKVREGTKQICENILGRARAEARACLVCLKSSMEVEKGLGYRKGEGEQGVMRSDRKQVLAGHGGP